MGRAAFEVKPFPRERHDVVDALEVGVRRHMVHALLEFDVTRARELIRDRETRAGEKISFTAFIVASLARAPSTRTGFSTRTATGEVASCSSTRSTS